MTATKRAFWLRLNGYHFDHLVPPKLWNHVAHVFGGPDASTRAFADKLARKLGWTTDFAQSAIAEYKKFVYLGVVSDFNVTPSKVIDQVWHEHLLFTRAYATFCREVLGTDFDHNPELVPTDRQTGVFQAQYLETLDRYRTEFDAEPPADIWSVPKFKGDAVKRTAVESRRRLEDSWASSGGNDAPLYTYFVGPIPDDHPHHALGGFDGGRSGGAGASDSWNEAHRDAHHADTGGHATDAGGHDAGGSDAGGSDAAGGSSGGSGCSSGCGGGGD